MQPNKASAAVLLIIAKVSNLSNVFEIAAKARGEWFRALENIAALHPPAVVAGHSVLDPDSSRRHIEETQGYLRDYDATVASTSTALDLYEKMPMLDPNQVSLGSLWAAAKAVKRVGSDL